MAAAAATVATRAAPTTIIAHGAERPVPRDRQGGRSSSSIFCARWISLPATTSCHITSTTPRPTVSCYAGLVQTIFLSPRIARIRLPAVFNSRPILVILLAVNAYCVVAHALLSRGGGITSSSSSSRVLHGSALLPSLLAIACSPA